MQGVSFPGSLPARILAGFIGVGYNRPFRIEFQDEASAPHLDGRKEVVQVARHLLAAYFPA